METKGALNTQKVWGWKVAAYLFLAGVGAGAYLIGFIFSLAHPEFILLSKVTVLLAAPLVIVGALFLILDLGQKTLAPLVFLRPLSSWIARGTIIITVFIILDLIHIGMWIWPFTWLEGALGLRLALGGATSVFAVLTLIYTGLLLGTAKPIPFWSISILPVLFLVSGVSTGTMGAAFSLSAYSLSTGSSVEPPLMLLARYDAFVIILEALIICFYLIRMYRLTAARTSAYLVTKGSLAVHFWGGVVIAGLAVPFAFEVYNTYLPIANPMTVLVLTAVASIIGLIGGFMLRYVVVSGGTRTPLNVEGVLVPPPDPYRVKVTRRAAS